ncbi:MAG: hypothetical protein H0T17_02845 [Propionibacteriales bacterium]|nr:hypothetical protein [Propionibacteriales bacterium]
MAFRKAWILVVGWLLVVLGIIAMPLPGPGLLILLAGLVVLSQEYEWAERRVEPVKEKAFDVAKASVSSYPKILLSALGACSIIAFGLFLGIDPQIPHLATIPEVGPVGPIEIGPAVPLGGWATGSSIVFSGLIALVLLLYSLKRWRGETVAERRAEKATRRGRSAVPTKTR